MATIKYIFFLFLITKAYSLDLQSLNGQWKLSSTNFLQHDLLVNVPGGIFTDLMNNNIIEDVFYGFNDNNTRWVSYNNWTYSRIITVTETLLSHDNINLLFDGVDTFATILLNKVELGVTDNMFVQYLYDIKSNLKLGDNILELRFDSPVNKAKELYEVQLKSYLVPPICVPREYNGECHVNHIRKMQASFSWDWGPALPSIGIWKNVTIQAYNTTLIKDLTISVQSNNNYWNITVNNYFLNNTNGKIVGKLLFKLFTDLDAVEIVSNINITGNSNNELISTQSFSVPKSHVKLWWPNGYGEQNLYILKVIYTENGSEQSVKRIRIGFRTVELIQNKLEVGTTFYFQVNSVPIFAKGSNSIPINILPELGQNKTQIRYLLQSAKDVNMNMLRVWGGGVYESDYFYEVADEFGLMIWQDFMFACSMYPVNEEYLTSVRMEVQHQIRRLQYHPSIVLWAGNNENEAALRQNWYGTSIDFDRYKKDYVKLYVDTVRAVVRENDVTRTFLTSSPTNGDQSDDEGFIAEHPGSNLYGDVHFYNYILDSWDSNIYPITRFASEYGYQSLPSFNSLQKATNISSDLIMVSDFLNHRQHHPFGYAEMKVLIEYRLTLPDERSVNYTRAFIFYGQIVQAMAIRIETEHYRQWRGYLNQVGEGLTMGALYWQLNDVWLAPTWAGIDYLNNWKMLHYYAKHFFAPIIITSRIQHSRDVNVFVVSDKLTNAFNLTASIVVFNWTSFEPLSTNNVRINILAGSSTNIISFWLDQYLVGANCGTLATAKFNCFIHLSVKDSLGNLVTPENYIMPASLKEVDLPKAEIQLVSVTALDETRFELVISSSKIGLFVWLDVGDYRGRFSDNGFWQTASNKTVIFTSDTPISSNDLEAQLSISHLMHPQFLS